MKVIAMRPPAGSALTEALASVQTRGPVQLEFGTACLPGGGRVPVTGESRHADMEVSYVVSGVVDVVHAGGVSRIRAGDLVIVPPEEWHYSDVLEEANLVYIFVKEAGSP